MLRTSGRGLRSRSGGMLPTAGTDHASARPNANNVRHPRVEPPETRKSRYPCAAAPTTAPANTSHVVFTVLAGASIRHAFLLMRAQNEGQDFYECIDEEKPLKYVPVRKGFGWTNW